LAEGKFHIGYDAKRLFFNESGLGNYSRTLVENILDFSREQGDSNLDISLFTSKLPSLKFNNKHTGIGNALLGNSMSVITPKYIHPLWRTWGMGRSAGDQEVDVFHGLSNELPIDLPKRILPVVTIHDVLFKQFPKQYSWIDRVIYHQKTSFALKKASKIIATSKATALDIHQYYSVPLSKIDVVYQSIQKEFVDQSFWVELKENKQDLPELITRITSESPYLIYHSTFNYRKNHLRLLRAFEEIKDQVEFNLILPGFMGRSWKKVGDFIKEKQLQHRVYPMGEVSTAALIYLLSNASGFIYPSLNEGFGIPLAEAAALKLPFMVSDIPVFRELMGEGHHELLFQPKDVTSIARALLTMNEQLQQSHGVEHWTSVHSEILEKTHPNKVAEQLLRIYQR